MDKGFKHGYGKAAFTAFCPRARASVDYFCRYAEFGVRVGAKVLGKVFEFGFELRTCICAAHGAFHAKLECHLFKDRAVFVLTVVYGVYQLMHQGVEYLNAIA